MPGGGIFRSGGGVPTRADWSSAVAVSCAVTAGAYGGWFELITALSVAGQHVTLSLGIAGINQPVKAQIGVGASGSEVAGPALPFFGNTTDPTGRVASFPFRLDQNSRIAARLANEGNASNVTVRIGVLIVGT